MNITVLSELLEAFTIICFGLSWPISIRKSLISKTGKGKSLFFEVFLLIGYALGIMRKIIQVSSLNCTGFVFFLGFFFYVLNFIMVGADLILYVRNYHLDKKNGVI